MNRLIKAAIVDRGGKNEEEEIITHLYNKHTLSLHFATNNNNRWDNFNKTNHCMRDT